MGLPTLNDGTADTVIQELTRELRDDDTLLDPLSNRALITDDLRTFERGRAPKAPKRPTVSTSVPDFQSFLPLKQPGGSLRKLKAQDTQFWMVS